MPWLRILFLVTVLTATSGYRFRCYWLCIDQTSTQNDYVEQRDRCREYAELKLDMALRENGGPFDEKGRKAQLVSLFSDCMANNGWSVPDGKGDKKPDAKPAIAAAAAPATAAAAAAAAANPTPNAPVPAPSAMTNPTPDAIKAAGEREHEKAHLSRKAECDFARYGASTSSIAATRAEACDLECAAALKNAPGAPRPAACPSDDLSKNLSSGYERD